MFDRVQATSTEIAAARPGDQILPSPDVVMDRAFTVEAPPDSVWPWLVQLGKRRAGWYLPRRVERLVPARRRAARSIDERWLDLAEGDIIPDYGGRDETFQVASIDPPRSLVYRSRRGRTTLTWSITLEPEPAGGNGTRVFLRLRLAPVRRKWLARTAGDLVDVLSIAGLAAGLQERLTSAPSAADSGG